VFRRLRNIMRAHVLAHFSAAREEASHLAGAADANVGMGAGAGVGAGAGGSFMDSLLGLSSSDEGE
jgi:hypothetical protein